MQEIEINGRKFKVIDAKEHMTIPDCFVKTNKIGTAHGEAKFYVGNESEELFGFFDDFGRECFFLKSDLEKYLDDAELEYKNPEQEYRNKKEMPKTWEAHKKVLGKIKNGAISFSIFRSRVTPPRVYINSNDEIYRFLREIALPGISYLSVLKLRSKEGEIFYYFKPFLDYHDLGEEDHPSLIREKEKEIEENETLTAEQRFELKIARRGQGRYKENLFSECPTCIITGVTDERILVACHIKPWVDSDDIEKTDPKNGLVLTPTYHEMLDRGFISFEDDGTLLVSPWISPMNQKRLGLRPKKKYSFDTDGRKAYLKYHRENIFNE